jgi:oligogalacturonide lyase
VEDRLIAAIDFVPTMLALAGAAKPDKMQGEIFLGDRAGPPRQYVFGARDRCDETVARFRTVRDARYRYIRNFMPERPFLQPNAYKERSYPVWNLLKELDAQGKLTPAQAFLTAPHMPPEELYDLQGDPHEIHNLTASANPEHQAALARLRRVLEKWLEDTNDQGRIPEPTEVAAAQGATRPGTNPNQLAIIRETPQPPKTEGKPADAKPQAAAEPPSEWIEPATGHRVIRLSREGGTSSFYFHQNPYTAAGDKIVVSTRRGLATINLQSRQMEPLGVERAGQVVVGKKTRQVFYSRDGSVYATHLDTRATREIVKLPAEIRGGSGLAVNADETLLAGSYVEAGPRRTPSGGGSLEARWAARQPMRLYTIDVRTGAVKTFHPSTDWLNHVQFSPTDPTLLMFCHEGPWHKVDRIWTIRTDDTNLQKIHARAMEMEIAGHEFFGPDGKTIWYDLQTPKAKEFWLAGHVLATGEKIRYRVKREEWSVHFNVSPDGKLFAGDGGGPRSVAAPGNGQWIYLFTPKDGALVAERLVDLSKHDYRLEPNVTFTPYGKWIVFRSNMHGPTHVYAVEVLKSP